MAEGRPRRVEIGFEDGPVLAVRLAADEIDRLRKAVQASEPGWFEVKTEDSEALVDLAQVVFVKVEAGERGIGFGG